MPGLRRKNVHFIPNLEVCASSFLFPFLGFFLHVHFWDICFWFCILLFPFLGFFFVCLCIFSGCSLLHYALFLFAISFFGFFFCLLHFLALSVLVLFTLRKNSEKTQFVLGQVGDIGYVNFYCTIDGEATTITCSVQDTITPYPNGIACKVSLKVRNFYFFPKKFQIFSFVLGMFRSFNHFHPLLY